MTKVFLTGATGFIGEKLAIHLVEEGYSVHALIRSPQKAKKLNRPGIILFQGDVLDTPSILEAMEGCEVGFHLAAYAKAWARDSKTFEKINVGGTQNILTAARQMGLKRMVLTSTGGIFGPSGKGLTDETGQPETATLTNYERSKLAADRLALEMMPKGPEVVFVHPTRVYGPGPLNDANGEVMVTARYLKGAFRFLPGDGTSTGSYVHVEDVARGHRLALERGRTGESYLLAGENASFREYFDLVGHLSGKRYPLYGVPIPLIMGFAKTQMWMAKNFGRPPLITPELVRKYSRNWSFSTQKAEEELGYTWIRLEEGLEKTVEWLKTHHLAKPNT